MQDDSKLVDKPFSVPRPLESAHFGIAISSCEPTTPEDVVASVFDSRRQRDALLIARVSTDSAAAIQEIERHGGTLCDVLVTATRSLEAVPWNTERSGASVELRLATHKDADAVASVAERAFADFRGHWHTDPRIPRELAIGLYRKWAFDLVRGIGSQLAVHVVEDSTGRIVAFIAVRYLEAGLADVPLTAVAPEARSRGLLAFMIAEIDALLSRQQVRTLAYETQIGNLPALRTVLRHGFIPSSSRITFHMWLDKTLNRVDPLNLTS